MRLSTLLFVVFLVLKLTGVIAWSWLWVTAPLWIGFGISLVFVVVVTVLAGAATKSAAGALRNYQRSLR